MYEWECMHPGIELRLKHTMGGPSYYLQPGDDMQRFQEEIGAVDFVWMNDPENKEGRVFKTIEEHYDAIMDPYLGNE